MRELCHHGLQTADMEACTGFQSSTGAASVHCHLPLTKSFGHSLPLIADYKSSWARQRYGVSGIKSWVCACLRGYVNCIIFVWVFPLLLDTVSCLKAVINTDMTIMKNMSGNEQRKLFFVRKVALMDKNYV